MYTEVEREAVKATKPSSKKPDDIKGELERTKQWEDTIQRAAKRFDVRPEEIRAIIGTESAAHPNRRADDNAKEKSAGGARGLMQVVKATWDQVKGTYPELAPYDFESNWNKPAVNIMFGAATLALKRKALKKFGLEGPNSNKMSVIAYNAGEGVVKEAYRAAKEAGSTQPDVDFMKFEHLAHALRKFPSSYRYWMPGKTGGKQNKSGTVDEAIKLKIEREVMGYAGKVEERMKAQGTTLDRKGSADSKPPPPTEISGEAEGKFDVSVDVGEMSPILPGHMISASVGRGGTNRPGDVIAVQRALNRLGLNAGNEDAQIGKITIGAIERFQQKFMRKPDGLVEVGKRTEQQLLAPATKTAPKQPKQPKQETPNDTTKETKHTGGGSTTATPGRGWGGCEGLGDLALSIASSMGVPKVPDKRSKTDFGGGRKSTTKSDHHVSQGHAYALDFGVQNKFGPRAFKVGTELANQLAKAYGLTGPYIGTYHRHYITAGGRKFRIQLLWQVKDHYDHVHIGFRAA